MPKATLSGGELLLISNCYIEITGKKIYARELPDFQGDSKSATYSDEVVIGRSSPIKTFSHSDNRIINIDWPFIVLKKQDITNNLNNLRLIQSAVYPRDNSVIYKPPPICKIFYGKLLGDTGVCAILRSCNMRPRNDVPIDPKTLLPYRFTVSLSFEVVYSSVSLPGQEKIAKYGS